MRRLTMVLICSVMLLSPMLASAQPADAAAEIAFWTSVKDSRSPAEIKAYLDKFPNGTFADLAKLRIKALEQPAAAATPPKVTAPVAAPTSPPPAQSQASALLSADVIREMQNRLYNLNYAVGAQTGQVTAELRAAIRRWQANTKRPETGDMTAVEVAALRAATLSTTWGALAYNARGGAYTAWNRTNRQTAAETATEDCKKLKGGSCDVVTAADTACGALAHASGRIGSTIYNNVYAVVRPTLAEAVDVALNDCRRLAKVPNQCGVRTTFCANGSHKK